jgi:hypothetical protein
MLGLVLTGCVVTDPVEFKNEVDVPPTIIDDPQFPNGSIILFENVEGGGEKALRIQPKIRDENVDQVLKVRLMITRAADAIVYTCPETALLGGSTLRDYDIVVPQIYLNPGECHKVDVAVSGHFTRCRDDKELAEKLFADVDEDHSGDIARATFWVWEVSNNVLGNAAATQNLVNSCKAIEYDAVNPPGP